MIRVAALIVRDSSASIRFAGLDLATRAERAVRRAGIDHVQVVDDERPFADAPHAEVLLVLPTCAVFEPAAVRELAHRGLRAPEDAAAVADANGFSTGVM